MSRLVEMVRIQQTKKLQEAHLVRHIRFCMKPSAPSCDSPPNSGQIDVNLWLSNYTIAHRSDMSSWIGHAVVATARWLWSCVQSGWTSDMEKKISQCVRSIIGTIFARGPSSIYFPDDVNILGLGIVVSLRPEVGDI